MLGNLQIFLTKILFENHNILLNPNDFGLANRNSIKMQKAITCWRLKIWYIDIDAVTHNLGEFINDSKKMLYW